MEKAELDKLIKLVDQFISSLKKDLLSVEIASKGFLPGVWDKMKNWWYNLTKKGGPNDPENPYVYKNKFGVLGQTQESKRLSLSQYKFIRECYENLEENLNILSEETAVESENVRKLKLFKIIDSWADKFKKEIIRQFSDNNFKPEDQKQMNLFDKDGNSIANKGSIKTNDEIEDNVLSADASNAASMSGVPENKPASSGSLRPIVKDIKKNDEEDNPGAGRPGSGLNVIWSGQKLGVKIQIEGVSKIRSLSLERLLPISVLLNKQDEEIKKLESSAENNIKLIVYKDLINQIPGETRRRVGQDDEDGVTFDIDTNIFDEKFKEIFEQIIKEVTSQHIGKERTKGNHLTKMLIIKIYQKMDDIFKDRAERINVDKINKWVNDALGDIND